MISTKANGLDVYADLAGNGDIRQVLAELIQNARIEIKRDPKAAELCLDQFESLLRPKHAKPAAAAAFGSGGLAAWQEARVKQHIDANLADRLSTTQLSKLVRLSENHFARSFKATFGYPPHAYVIRRRVRRAKELILTTDMPLAQIAVVCGLADQAHLSRIFRREVGASPSAWRRQHRVLSGGELLVVAPKMLPTESAAAHA